MAARLAVHVVGPLQPYRDGFAEAMMHAGQPAVMTTASGGTSCLICPASSRAWSSPLAATITSFPRRATVQPWSSSLRACEVPEVSLACELQRWAGASRRA